MQAVKVVILKTTSTKKFDILGLGCTAVDDVVYVPTYPGVDVKTPILGSVRRCGGLTGIAIVAATRIGAVCNYAGCLGTDEFSRYVAEYFKDEGINLSDAPYLPEGRVIHSVIIVARDTGSRNIFYENAGMIGAHHSLPAESIITDTKVLFIDHYGMSGNLRAARIAKAAGIPIVADFEDASSPQFNEVMSLVDHLVLSAGFSRQITGMSTPEKAALALWENTRAVVIVTCGAQGCWSVSAENPTDAIHHPAFRVTSSDTTGCGDVFHGAYAARLAAGDDLSDRIRYAMAAAALKASEIEIPTLDAVERFLDSQSKLNCQT